MKTISLAADPPSGKVTVGAASYLVEPADWRRAFASRFADQEGFALTDLDRNVTAFKRSCHGDHGIAADARFVLKFLGAQPGLDKAGAKHEHFEPFPHGYVKQACWMAGMRRPRARSTG